MRREGLDSEYTVTSSSGYSSSSEVKAGSSEVRRFPGIIYWKSRVERDKYELSLIFRMRKHTWHWELIYSRRLSQGCMKNKDNTRKEQMEGAWGAMSRIIIQQENERQLDTIRARVMERSIWRQGWGIAHGTRSDGSENVGIIRKCAEACGSVRSRVKGWKSCEGLEIAWRVGNRVKGWKSREGLEIAWRVGNQVAEFGFEYFCPDYVSKIGMSVMERNTVTQMSETLL